MLLFYLIFFIKNTPNDTSKSTERQKYALYY